MEDALASAHPLGGMAMTAQDIIDRLFFSPTKPRVIDKERVRKAQGLALRSKIEWGDVVEGMTSEQRKAVIAANRASDASQV